MSWEYLNKLCERGLNGALWGQTSAGRMKRGRRLRRTAGLSSLDVIQKMGYVDYFLIVWDFIHYARESNGIAVGPGRGSAAGSIVSYCLEITNIDPIRYQLLFERFLNPERVSMPDIDIDFCYERRQEVIDYVNKKIRQRPAWYRLLPSVRWRLSGVIRDVGRVMDLPYVAVRSGGEDDPAGAEHYDWTKALDMNRELKNLYESDERVQKPDRYVVCVWKGCRGIRPCMQPVL